MKTFINYLCTGILHINLAFQPIRNKVPELNSTGTTPGTPGSTLADNAETRSASCAWSFCSGQDSELPLSPDEEINLINFSSVGINYGSQPINGESPTEEAGRRCELPCSAGNIALAMGIAVMDLIVAAGLATGNTALCSLPDRVHDVNGLCILSLVTSGPVIVGAFGVTVVGVKRLVDAYRAGNNSQSNPNA
ncbi:MAG TPA: hypothetical protein VF797_11820 [Noviherbaspirillum sp.]